VSDELLPGLVKCPECGQIVFDEIRDFERYHDEPRVKLCLPRVHNKPCGLICIGSLPAFHLSGPFGFFNPLDLDEWIRVPGTKPSDYCLHMPWQFCDERSVGNGPQRR
jgi:hypothetical protein